MSQGPLRFNDYFFLKQALNRPDISCVKSLNSALFGPFPQHPNGNGPLTVYGSAVWGMNSHTNLCKQSQSLQNKQTVPASISHFRGEVDFQVHVNDVSFPNVLFQKTSEVQRI